MRILGIDPGSRLTGVGIIDCANGQASCIHYQTIRTIEAEFPQRLGQIFTSIHHLMLEYQPHQVAIEKVFVNNNAESSLKLGQARGAAICAVVQQDVPVAEYSPNAVKKALVGRGHADKSQVEHMVKVLLNLQKKIPADAADALAVALCDQHHTETRARFTHYQSQTIGGQP